MINFVDKFKYMLEEASCPQEEGQIINYGFQGKMCREMWCRILTMSLLESPSYGMVS